MTIPDQDNGAAVFEVAVAVVPIAPATSDRDTRPSGIPGYDDTWGRSPDALGDRGQVLLRRGEDAVRVATEAIAAQIGVTARRVAGAIERESWPPASQDGGLALQSVEISFGVTLSAGIQAWFTAQAESSAQVTITFAR
jgi:hypothetical protein